MATKAHIEGNKRYLDKQDNIIIRVPKGKKAVIQEYAQKKEKSLNKYIVDLIDEDMKKE
ncbi:MAG: antitoxin [Clostridia bacterium]|nr:antitoxin [Clostridia bacterium]